MLNPEQFMEMISNLPERERVPLLKIWDDIFSRTMAQSHGLTHPEAVRLGIMQGYLQAVYDGICNREMAELKNRIIRL